MSQTTHRYIGPTTVWGLQHGAPCTLLPHRGPSGMVKITAHGRTWNVMRSQLAAAAPKTKRGLRRLTGRA